MGKHLCHGCLSFFGDEEAIRSKPPQGRTGTPEMSGSFRNQAEPAPAMDPFHPPSAQTHCEPGQPPAGPNSGMARPAQFRLEGIWNSQVQTAYGAMTTQLILQPGGKFSQQSVMGPYMTYDVGTYTVGEGYIHFNVQDHEPKMYNGQQMHWITSWTYFYTIVNENAMTFEDRVANSRWTVYRG
jgi:hypothetical protein